MVEKIDWKLYEDFKKFWMKDGYKYTSESEDESDWLIVVKYWTWVGYRKGRKHDKK